MPKFAENTTVSSTASVSEIESTLRRYGGRNFHYATLDAPPCSLVGFEFNGRRIRFVVSLPEIKEFQTTETGRARTAQGAATNAHEKAIRQRWRALLLVIKAKLEAVESGICEFDEEFGMHFVMPDGGTVYERIRDGLGDACATGHLPSIFPAAYAALPAGGVLEGQVTDG